MAVTGPEAHPLVLILAASVVLQTQMAASGSVGSEALKGAQLPTFSFPSLISYFLHFFKHFC